MNINATKARLGSISPSTMDKLPLAVKRLLNDLEFLIGFYEGAIRVSTLLNSPDYKKTSTDKPNQGVEL